MLCRFREFIFQFPALCFRVSVLSPFCKSLSTRPGCVLTLKEGGLLTREKWNQCSALVDGCKNAVGSCASSRVQVVSRSLPTGLQVAQGQPGHPSPPKPAAPRSLSVILFFFFRLSAFDNFVSLLFCVLMWPSYRNLKSSQTQTKLHNEV